MRRRLCCLRPAKRGAVSWSLTKTSSAKRIFRGYVACRMKWEIYELHWKSDSSTHYHQLNRRRQTTHSSDMDEHPTAPSSRRRDGQGCPVQRWERKEGRRARRGAHTNASEGVEKDLSPAIQARGRPAGRPTTAFDGSWLRESQECANAVGARWSTAWRWDGPREGRDDPHPGARRCCDVPRVRPTQLGRASLT
jgi:hypothetical protein